MTVKTRSRYLLQGDSNRGFHEHPANTRPKIYPNVTYGIYNAIFDAGTMDTRSLRGISTRGEMGANFSRLRSARDGKLSVAESISTGNPLKPPLKYHQQQLRLACLETSPNIKGSRDKHINIRRFSRFRTNR